MNFKIISCFGCCVLGMCLSGCDDPLSGDQYITSEAKQVNRVSYGTIQSKRLVKIKRHEGAGAGAGLGIAGGALGGALIGNAVSSGNKGQVIGGAIGALAGGLAGNAIQNRNVDGCEYTIALDEGGTVAITQGKTPELSVGQRVKVIYNNSGGRVVPTSGNE